MVLSGGGPLAVAWECGLIAGVTRPGLAAAIGPRTIDLVRRPQVARAGLLRGVSLVDVAAEFLQDACCSVQTGPPFPD